MVEVKLGLPHTTRLDSVLSVTEHTNNQHGVAMRFGLLVDNNMSKNHSSILVDLA